MKVFDEKQLKAFMNADSQQQFEYIVKADIGNVDNVLKDKIPRGRNMAFLGIQDVLTDYTIMLDIHKKTSSDEVIIRAKNYELSSKENLYRRFLSEDDKEVEDIYSTLSIAKLNRRAGLIAALVLTALVPDAVLYGYMDESNVNFQALRAAKHEDIYLFLRQHMLFTRDFEMNFHNAFHVLWYKLKQDITGFDSEIKAITLEEFSVAIPENVIENYQKTPLFKNRRRNV